ncbi:MAG: calcium-binding protein [Candidatus Bipolaricaulia bacterium]
MTFLEKIKGSYERITKECQAVVNGDGGLANTVDPNELARVVVGYLSVMLSRTADYNTSLGGWENTREGIDHVFSRQALPMKWDYCETSVFSRSSGDWLSHLAWILRYTKVNDWRMITPLQAQHSSATALPHADNSLDAVITDPPYYDNVPYAALSDFFYVWLKRAVGNQFPELFSTPVVPKREEIIMEPTRHESTDDAKVFFEQMLGKSFQEMHRILKPGGIAVVVYAHKTTEGWETMLNGLVNAGFVVTGSWPVHTEMKTRLRAAQSVALASSIYMVCRKTNREPVGFWNDIQSQVKARVEEKLDQFWKAGIAGGDFFISAIGPGMEAFSRYERVETYDGKPVGVLELLQYIRSVATEFLVHRLLKDASSESIDKEAPFYLTYRWTYLDNMVLFDDARKIASAEGVNLEWLWVEERGDRLRVTGFALVDDLYGIIVDVKRGRRKYAMPLCDLEVIDEKSPNHQVVKDYAMWFANH